MFPDVGPCVCEAGWCLRRVFPTSPAPLCGISLFDFSEADARDTGTPLNAVHRPQNAAPRSPLSQLLFQSAAVAGCLLLLLFVAVFLVAAAPARSIVQAASSTIAPSCRVSNHAALINKLKQTTAPHPPPTSLNRRFSKRHKTPTTSSFRPDTCVRTLTHAARFLGQAHSRTPPPCHR